LTARIEPIDRTRFHRIRIEFHDLKAAATAFSQGQVPEVMGWAKVETRRAL